MYNSREAAAQMAQREMQVVGTTFVLARVEDILYHACMTLSAHLHNLYCMQQL